MNSNIKEYIRLNFERALHDGHITVCYEPVVRALTGKICSLEALARWDDPIHGLIPPQTFIPVLEECKKIHLLDHFIMKQAAIDQYHHRQQEIIQPPVILNLSRRDFTLMNPCRELGALTEKYHLPHSNFQIEVTETAFVEDEEAISSALRCFRAHGYAIILDNFGHGYSSLTALQHYAIDEISLDRRFFQEFNEETRKILTSIVLMTKNLGIHIAAEGVNTLSQVQFLRNIGCEKIQGDVVRQFLPNAEDIASQLRESFSIETPVEGQIFNQAGLTNLITDTPVAILMDDGNIFSLLAANEAYKKELHTAGLSSFKEANRIIEFLPTVLRDKIRTLANQAISSRKTEEMTCIGEGQYFHFHLKTLAGTNGLYLHRAELRHLHSENKVRDNTVHYDRVVRNILHIYQDIYLVDLADNRIEVLESAVSRYPVGQRLHGIMKSFLEYASHHIHEADRSRFLRFIRDLGQQQQPSHLDPNTISGLFRVRQSNGNYRWKTFEVVFFRQKNHPCRLICLRDFLFENHPHKEELLRTVMASYGFNSFASNNNDSINDAQLWYSLMHFSHRKLFWKDKEGRFLGASPAFLHFYGLESSNDLIGKTDDDIGWHISNAKMDSNEEAVLQKGIPVHNGHGQCITRGRQHTISFSKYPIYDGLNIVGLLGEFRDLEEQEQQQALQRRLYLIDEETNFYNYRGMILASVEFADNLRLHDESYVGAMLVVPEFDIIAKTYGPHIRKRLLLYLRDIIRREMPANLVAAHTGSGIFVLLQKNISLGEMRERLKEIKQTIIETTEIDSYACTMTCHYALEDGTEGRTSDEFLKILSERCLGTLPAFGITGLRGDYISFELEKFDHLNRLIYIANASTRELVYANPAFLKQFHLPEDFHYAGKKCYEIITGGQEPCRSCPLEHLAHDRFSFRKVHLPWISRDYWDWKTLISWNGHDYIFADGIEIKSIAEASSVPEIADVQDDIPINDIIALSIREEDPTKGIMRILAKLGQALEAEHVVLMEEENDGFHLNCSYEWTRSDCPPLQPQLHHLPILNVKPIYDAFAENPILLIEDSLQFKKQHPDLSFFVPSIKRFAAGHVVIGDRSLGYITILNPTKEKLPAAAPLLQTAIHVSSILLRNRDTLSYLHELSTVDQLTDIGNRRALDNYLKDKIQNGVSYAIIFTDINGLKKTNDTYGHERGDLLIQTVAFVLTEIMGRGRVFRLGGDEFLSITPCENAIGAGNLLQRIEVNLKAHKASAALGYVIEKAPFGDIDALIKRADANMYHDKQQKHMTREELT